MLGGHVLALGSNAFSSFVGNQDKPPLLPAAHSYSNSSFKIKRRPKFEAKPTGSTIKPVTHSRDDMSSTSSSPLGQETPDNVVEKVMRRVEVAKVRVSQQMSIKLPAYLKLSDFVDGKEIAGSPSIGQL